MAEMTKRPKSGSSRKSANVCKWVSIAKECTTVRALANSVSIIKTPAMTDDDFRAAILANTFNEQALERLEFLQLPESHLTAGCLFQTIWNERSGYAPDWGIKDYDVFYFDEDMSYEAENRVSEQVAEAMADLPIAVEVKNQARVHLWYAGRFGGFYPQLRSARDGIDRYLISCTCVGISVQGRDLYAPYGFNELHAGLLRMNPKNPKPDQFREKAENYRQRWSWLEIAG